MMNDYEKAISLLGEVAAEGEVSFSLPSVNTLSCLYETVLNAVLKLF